MRGLQLPLPPEPLSPTSVSKKWRGLNTFWSHCTSEHTHGCTRPFRHTVHRHYLNDLQHLHACDLSVPVQVVHVEGPVELLLEAAARRDGEGADELPEVDGAVPVLIECPEGVLSKLGSVSIREELGERSHNRLLCDVSDFILKTRVSKVQVCIR